MKIDKKLTTKSTPWAKDNHPQMEIRVSDGIGSQALFVVAVDGWNLKDRSWEARNPTKKNSWYVPPPSVGKQVRVSMNGPLILTMSEWKQLTDIIDKAYQEVLDEYTVRGL